MADAKNILKDDKIISCAFNQADHYNYNYMFLLDESKAKNEVELALYKLINDIIKDYTKKRKNGIKVFSSNKIDIKINQFRLKHWYFKKIDFYYERQFKGKYYDKIKIKSSLIPVEVK